MQRYAKVIADIIYKEKRILLSLQQLFLPMHCRGKLKNPEIALAFYCQCTKHLNFEGCPCVNNTLTNSIPGSLETVLLSIVVQS